MASFFGKLWTKYNVLLKKRPLITRCVTSGVIIGTGDIFAQNIEIFARWIAKNKQLEQTSTTSPSELTPANTCTPAPLLRSEYFNIVKEEFSPLRSFKMFGTGMCIIGPNVFTWFRFLEKVFPGHSWKSVICKVTTDQLFFAPYIITVNFSTVGLLNGRSPEQVMDKVKQDIVPTLIRGAFVWPAANLIGFRFVPYEYRMLFTNLVSLVWNSYLSIVNHRIKIIT